MGTLGSGSSYCFRAPRQKPAPTERTHSLGAVPATETWVTWVTDAMLSRWLSTELLTSSDCVVRVVVLAAEWRPAAQSVIIGVTTAVILGTCFTTLPDESL